MNEGFMLLGSFMVLVGIGLSIASFFYSEITWLVNTLSRLFFSLNFAGRVFVLGICMTIIGIALLMLHSAGDY